MCCLLGWLLICPRTLPWKPDVVPNTRALPTCGMYREGLEGGNNSCQPKLVSEVLALHLVADLETLGGPEW